MHLSSKHYTAVAWEVDLEGNDIIGAAPLSDPHPAPHGRTMQRILVITTGEHAERSPFRYTLEWWEVNLTGTLVEAYRYDKSSGNALNEAFLFMAEAATS